MAAKKVADEVDTSAFVGVSPEYQNYADDTLKPFLSEDKDVRRLEENAIEAEKNRAVEYNSYGMPVPKKEEAKKAPAKKAAPAKEAPKAADDKKDEAPKAAADEKKDEA